MEAKKSDATYYDIYYKDYYTKNKEKISAKLKEYKTANRDKVNQYHRDYYKANKDKIKEQLNKDTYCEACKATVKQYVRHERTNKHKNNTDALKDLVVE
jgi:NAD(P)H-nitrite reductase large subunit